MNCFNMQQEMDYYVDTNIVLIEGVVGIEYCIDTYGVLSMSCFYYNSIICLRSERFDV